MERRKLLNNEPKLLQDVIPPVIQTIEKCEMEVIIPESEDKKEESHSCGIFAINSIETNNLPVESDSTSESDSESLLEEPENEHIDCNLIIDKDDEDLLEKEENDLLIKKKV